MAQFKVGFSIFSPSFPRIAYCIYLLKCKLFSVIRSALKSVMSRIIYTKTYNSQNKHLVEMSQTIFRRFYDDQPFSCDLYLLGKVVTFSCHLLPVTFFPITWHQPRIVTACIHVINCFSSDDKLHSSNHQKSPVSVKGTFIS